MKSKIFVTKPYLPPIEEYTKKIKSIWKTYQLTNDGRMVEELEKRLEEYLEVKHVFYVSNGTIAIQIALRAFGITKSVITTPFTYVATTNAVLWEKCRPVFVDIDPSTFCIDPAKIESAITKDTQGILGVHVYGYPCDVKAIEKISRKYNLKVIYDAAHAFGTELDGKSILRYGDISTVSFHATKLFHTGEGGAVITNDDRLAKKIELLRSFGHIDDEYIEVGINARNSEFHAALGLSNLEHINDIIKKRKEIVTYYDLLIGKSAQIVRPELQESVVYNYSYYPILLESEEILLKIKNILEKNNIYPRRYFYPSLNKLPFVENKSCPISESSARRILCLPLSTYLKRNDVEFISNLIISALKSKTIKKDFSRLLKFPYLFGHKGTNNGLVFRR